MRLDAGDTFEKQYFRRSLEGFRSPYNDPFEYRTVNEVGEDVVIGLMLPFVDDKTNPDRLAQARIEWDGLTDADTATYRPENWLVAYYQAEPIGIVFPTRFVDIPEEGSISMIGVFP